MTWIIVIFAVAAFYAIRKAIPALLRAIAGIWKNWGSLKSNAAAKRQLAEDAADEGMAPRASVAGEKVGDAAAAVVSGVRVAWTAFIVNWKRGWNEGRARGEARRDQVPYAPTETETQAPACVPDAGDTDNEQIVHQNCRNCGQDVNAAPGLRLSGLCRPCTVDEIEAGQTEGEWVDTDPPASRTTSTTEGARTMPIETATGGEILTKDQFVKEMQALRAEQVAELEDAQAAEKHAMENNSRIEVMAASMSRLEISDQVIADVRQLADSTAAVQRLSQDRIKAAELRITAIDNALKSLDQSGQNQFFAA